MQFREFGLILFVERYEECISFYRNILRLKVRNDKETLVSFEISNGYLMVENGGVGSKKEKSRDRNPTVLRFDVDSLTTAVNELESRGVIFSQRSLKFDWGSIAVFNDPDGNRIELGELNSSSGSFLEN
ncbi:VOC family protein [Virgibacillus flavescens]|uniref:VOC family protein n=1 Tax=Virgibacillus flavescens TaxID=1611422 RepID=UPI003D32FFF4